MADRLFSNWRLSSPPGSMGPGGDQIVAYSGHPEELM